MKRIQSYKKFHEDASASGSSAGMGSVSNATASTTPGDVNGGISGSGDISFPMIQPDGSAVVYTKGNLSEPNKVKKKKKKKSQVSIEETPSVISQSDINKSDLGTITKVKDY